MSRPARDPVASVPRIVRTDDAVSVMAGPLRLVFRWDGARWSHALVLGGCTFAASIEGDPARDDHAQIVSPPYQQISIQEGAECLNLMLVGQWGPHHFSGVFTVAEGPLDATIDVDVAVRTRAPLDALAATYSVALSPGRWFSEAGAGQIVWVRDGEPRGSLRFAPAGTLGNASRVSRIELDPSDTGIQALAPIDAALLTHRLLYRWQWCDG